MPERATAVRRTDRRRDDPGTAVTAAPPPLGGVQAKASRSTRRPRCRRVQAPHRGQHREGLDRGTFDGYAGYNDLAYLLSSVLLGVTHRAPASTRRGRSSPPSRSSDVPKTFTLETGDANTSSAGRRTTSSPTSRSRGPRRTSHCRAPTWVGRSPTTPAPSAPPPTSPTSSCSPATPTFYLDTTSAGLGTTRLTRVIKAKLDIRADGPRRSSPTRARTRSRRSPRRGST